jgi:hypothetical protein
MRYGIALFDQKRKITNLHKCPFLKLISKKQIDLNCPLLPLLSRMLQADPSSRP